MSQSEIIGHQLHEIRQTCQSTNMAMSVVFGHIFKTRKNNFIEFRGGFFKLFLIKTRKYTKLTF